MPVEVDEFAPRRRRTKHPYGSWLTGRILQLERGVDFFGSARSTANSILSYAKRRDIAAVAFPVRDHDAAGAPERWVQLWGDPGRAWSDGPTAPIADKLRAAGHVPRSR